MENDEEREITIWAIIFWILVGFSITYLIFFN